MKLFRLERKQCLPVSIDEAWAFFSNPANLSEITPPSLNFRITSDVPDEIYAGLIITYKVSPLLGISVNWVAEITRVDRPHRFIDEQRLGPYRFWHHQHHFREIEGGVEMRDIIHYSLFGGSIGGIVANTMVVSRRLQEIFDYRRRYMNKKFGKMSC